MTKDDIEHLAALARIEISPEETAHFATEFDDILGYVTAIKELAGSGEESPAVGTHHNIFRDDTDPHEPGMYTEDILNAASGRSGRYIEVKKILDAEGS